MSTVSVPDRLINKLRSLGSSPTDDATELVVRALSRYVSLAETEELVRRAEEREAAMAHAGISEEEIAEHFDQWRHRQRSDR